MNIFFLDENFYSKFNCLSQIEVKICNLYRIVKPKKEDNGNDNSILQK